jgi:hypothetical protein
VVGLAGWDASGVIAGSDLTTGSSLFTASLFAQPPARKTVRLSAANTIILPCFIAILLMCGLLRQVVQLFQSRQIIQQAERIAIAIPE